MACINRSLEDMESLIAFAKLSSSSLLSTSQTLEFPSDYNPHSTTLIQLPDKLVNGLKKGDILTLRGEPEDFAVMCTSSETYEVREAETSNSLLLVPGLFIPDALGNQIEKRVIVNKMVTGIHYKFLELRECLPRLSKLRTLLSQAPYAEPHQREREHQKSGKVYTFDELLDAVQCGEEQLLEALEALPTVNMNGCWHLLQLEYMFTVVSSILSMMEEQQWPLDAVPYEAVIQKVSEEVPLRVVTKCLEYFFKKRTDSDTHLVAVDDDRLSRLFAEMLLKPAGKFNLEEFLTIWQQSVPPGVNTSLSQLEGLALVDRSTSPSVLWLYHVHCLPEDPQQRFAALFRERQSWTLADITPYIRDLSSSKCSVNSLLAKHTRAATQNGIKCYSAKYCK